ncbi:MAG: PIN domain-containing protein, partial [Burkholderiales bacterium]
NACIQLINKKRGHEETIKHLETIPARVPVLISSIVESELRYGIAKSRDTTANTTLLDRFFLDFSVVAYDSAAARAYGEIRAVLESKGKAIGPLDTLIAAHALSSKATLITNNIREFSRVPGLTCENWVA